MALSSVECLPYTRDFRRGRWHREAGARAVGASVLHRVRNGVLVLLNGRAVVLVPDEGCV